MLYNNFVLIGIEILSGAKKILKDYPHLKNAQVSPIFSKIVQNDDGSFEIKGFKKTKWSINVEDGRQTIWSNPTKNYCSKTITSNCSPWYGDREHGEILFKPGPDKNRGKTEYLYWGDLSNQDNSKQLIVTIVGIICLFFCIIKS